MTSLLNSITCSKNTSSLQTSTKQKREHFSIYFMRPVLYQNQRNHKERKFCTNIFMNMDAISSTKYQKTDSSNIKKKYLYCDQVELTPMMEGLFYIQQPINVTTFKLIELKKKKHCKVHLNACSIIIWGGGTTNTPS